MNVAAWPSVSDSGIATSCRGDTTTSLAYSAEADARAVLPVTDGHAVDAVSQFGDPADDLSSGHERQRGFDLVAALDQQTIHEVDTGGRHGEADLASLQRSRVAIDDAEILDRTEFRTLDDSDHDADLLSPASADARHRA